MPQQTSTAPLYKVSPDIPDKRDRMYKPALVQLKPFIKAPKDLKILDQGREGACTGFGLAAVINFLNRERDPKLHVSPRMLYEMAKKFDKWPGEEYSGSSCRGAIKGWHSMGVCTDALAPYVQGEEHWNLSVKQARDARSQTIGAYYRIKKSIVDMHAAMNEVGVIYVSARVHQGWRKSAVRAGVIKISPKMIGGHAFAIVGYDATGFFVQNSWNKNWGTGGIAHWSYEDWQANVSDAWVVRLALPTPQLHGLGSSSGRGASGKSELFSKGPRRDDIAGHFVHFDDGDFQDCGKYWSNLHDVKQTARRVGKSNKYDHLMIYAHGGLNSTKDCASRILGMKDVFKQNRIYPFHFMYDTGLMEEIKDVLLGKRSSAEEMAGGFSDWWDRRVESTVHRPGRALWREMKFGAAAPFNKTSSSGSQGLAAFISAMNAAGGKPKKVHLVGHSTGAILLAHMLKALVRLKAIKRISSVSLLAPAATVELFESNYQPLINSPKAEFGIDELNVYNLSDDLEQDDNVIKIYRKSLLYLVSNALEENSEAPLLGMQDFAKKIDKNRRLKFIESRSKRRGSRTRSDSHGGFDNDPTTMNDVLKTILGKKPPVPFTAKGLDY